MFRGWRLLCGDVQWPPYADSDLDVICSVKIRHDRRVHGHVLTDFGGFKIDHPLDPTTRTYLCQSFVESPDTKNPYDGVPALNTKCEAVVKFPTWFKALNQDFRGAAPNLRSPSIAADGLLKPLHSLVVARESLSK
jgi:hypothetical protein